MKSQVLGDVTILLFIRQANCLVEIPRPCLAAAAAAALRESVHKIVKPHSSESKATSPQRRRASQLAEKHNNSKNKKNPQSAGERSAFQAEYSPSCLSLIVRATFDLRE